MKTKDELAHEIAAEAVKVYARLSDGIDKWGLPLTPRQQDALDALVDLIDTSGHSPSLEEIGAALGVSKVTAFELIGELDRKGWIKRIPGRARSIEIVTARTRDSAARLRELSRRYAEAV